MRMAQPVTARANPASQPKRVSPRPDSKPRQARLALRRDPVQKEPAEARQNSVFHRRAAAFLRTNPWTNRPGLASKAAQLHFSANQAQPLCQHSDPAAPSGAVKFQTKQVL